MLETVLERLSQKEIDEITLEDGTNLLHYNHTYGNTETALLLIAKIKDLNREDK